MPPAAGDWLSDENRRAMMRSWRRLYERLCRRFGRRPKAMHFKEHAGATGRLHLNVLWDWGWIDQCELAEIAAACGFGSVCHISRVGRTVELTQGRPGSSAAVRYSAKQGFRVVAYARKTGGQTAGQGDDWPKHVRRWSASRAASAEMGLRPHNPDWFWSRAEPPADIDGDLVVGRDTYLVVYCNSQSTYWLLPSDWRRTWARERAAGAAARTMIGISTAAPLTPLGRVAFSIWGRTPGREI
jgi:hypothetical protein